ncbi:MAG: hypothetical protein ACJZ9F_08870 [Rhodospirillaceae bacterium]
MSGYKARSRQRFAKGRRPNFLDSSDSDKLLAMVVALVGEVAVVKDRLDTHERLATLGKVATPDEIEAYSPDETVEDERETWRSAMLERVFRIISATKEQSDMSDSEAGYESLIEQFANDDKT